MQGPVRRLAATIEQAVVEQALYVQRAEDSEAAGQWNAEVSIGGCLLCMPPGFGGVFGQQIVRLARRCITPLRSPRMSCERSATA
jgi:hypothetical protein